MARRSRDWNEGLARDLRNREFAREFLLAAMDEGIPIQTALGKVIRAMGVERVREQGSDGQPERAARNQHTAQPDPGNDEPAAEAVPPEAESGPNRRAGQSPRRLM